MNYLGLDCSSLAVHGAIINNKEELISLHKWGSKEKEFIYRFPQIVVGFSEELSKIKEVNFAAIETAIFIQNPKATISIANVIGAIWGVLLSRNMRANQVKLIDNRQWKKVIVGKGNASKLEIKQFAIDKWGDKFPEQDYADAACIALWIKRRSENG